MKHFHFIPKNNLPVSIPNDGNETVESLHTLGF